MYDKVFYLGLYPIKFIWLEEKTVQKQWTLSSGSLPLLSVALSKVLAMTRYLSLLYLMKWCFWMAYVKFKSHYLMLLLKKLINFFIFFAAFKETWVNNMTCKKRKYFLKMLDSSSTQKLEEQKIQKKDTGHRNCVPTSKTGTSETQNTYCAYRCMHTTWWGGNRQPFVQQWKYDSFALDKIIILPHFKDMKSIDILSEEEVVATTLKGIFTNNWFYYAQSAGVKYR